jgi:hypothetical protein
MHRSIVQLYCAVGVGVRIRDLSNPRPASSLAFIAPRPRDRTSTIWDRIAFRGDTDQHPRGDDDEDHGVCGPGVGWAYPHLRAAATVHTVHGGGRCARAVCIVVVPFCPPPLLCPSAHHEAFFACRPGGNHALAGLCAKCRSWGGKTWASVRSHQVS